MLEAHSSIKEKRNTRRCGRSPLLCMGISGAGRHCPAWNWKMPKNKTSRLTNLATNEKVDYFCRTIWASVLHGNSAGHLSQWGLWFYLSKWDVMRYSVVVSNNINAGRPFSQHIPLHKQISTPRRPSFSDFLRASGCREKGWCENPAGSHNRRKFLISFCSLQKELATKPQLSISPLGRRKRPLEMFPVILPFNV